MPSPGRLSPGVWQVYLMLLPGNPNQGRIQRNSLHEHSYSDQWFPTGTGPPFKRCPGNRVCAFLVITVTEAMLIGIWWLGARLDRCVEQFHRTKTLSCLSFTCPSMGIDMDEKPTYSYLNIDRNSNFISSLCCT